MKNIFATLAIVCLAAIALPACSTLNSPDRVVLPLDHGPRAQVTPWQNQQRLRQIEAERAKAKG